MILLLSPSKTIDTSRTTSSGSSSAPRFISEAELIVNKLRSLNTNDLAKLMSIYAKKARGLMSQYIIKNKIDKVEELKLFDQAGYFYNDNLSNTKELIFTRG